MFETLFTYPRVLRRHREGPPGRGACRLPSRNEASPCRHAHERYLPGEPDTQPHRSRQSHVRLASSDTTRPSPAGGSFRARTGRSLTRMRRRSERDAQSDVHQMVLTRPVSETSRVTDKSAGSLAKAHRNTGIRAHPLPGRREPRSPEAPGHGVGAGSDRDGIVVQLPLVGDADVGTNRHAVRLSARLDSIAAAQDEGIAVDVGKVHRGGRAPALAVVVYLLVEPGEPQNHTMTGPLTTLHGPAEFDIDSELVGPRGTALGANGQPERD